MLVIAALAIKKIFDTPSRKYDQNVGDEYDQWTDEGVLEYYWGEHIHLGHYSEAERAAGYKKKDFIQVTSFTRPLIRGLQPIRSVFPASLCVALDSQLLLLRVVVTFFGAFRQSTTSSTKC